MKRIAFVLLLLLAPVLGTLTAGAQDTLCPDGQSWEGFDAGDEVTSFDWDGVHVTVDVVPNDSGDGPAVVFDTGCPGGCSGGDDDLETPGCNPTNNESRGNVLICQEGDISEPGDTAGGCLFVFDFDKPIILSEFGLLDIEESGGWIRLTSWAGETNCPIPSGTGACPGGAVGNNSFQTVGCAGNGVEKVEIYLTGSGSVTDLCGGTMTPVVLTGFAARGAPGAMAAVVVAGAVTVIAGAGALVSRVRTRRRDPPRA